MPTKTIRSAIGIAFLMVAVTFAYLRTRPRTEEAGVVRGSGTIEATEIMVGPRSGGRLAEIRVHEGDTVKAGDLIARLDTSELDAQVGQVEAALKVAEARLDAALNGARPEQIEAARAALAQANAAESGAAAAAGTAGTGYGRTTELRAAHDAARMRVKTAEAQMSDAEESLKLVRAGARSQQVDQARAAVTQSEAALRKADSDMRRIEALARDGAVSEQQRDAAISARDSAMAQLEQAKAALANLLAGARPEEIRRAEMGVAQARANLEAARLSERSAREALSDRLAARSTLDAARTGVATSRAQARAAKAQLDLLLAGTRPEEIRAANEQVSQAQETLRLVRVQRSYALIFAPAAGVVKTRVAEPGEMVTPGSPVVVLLDTARPWLRVFVPESRYGQ
ncbi:MAG: biotin/lipoyl-binding protein, partial [Armatimonadetes bacterium]|nr:biotin/lipoyl-binding protein [Armatimonadota bacterium]